MKKKKVIALSLISSLLITSFAQLSGNSVGVSAATVPTKDEVCAATAIPEPYVTPVPVSPSPSSYVEPFHTNSTNGGIEGGICPSFITIISTPEHTNSTNGGVIGTQSPIFSPVKTSVVSQAPSETTSTPTVDAEENMISPDFYFSKDSYYMNGGETYNFLIEGSFKGLHELYYRTEKLEKNVDYTYNDHYLRFSDEFMDQLPPDRNVFTGVGTSNVEGVDIKINFELQKKHWEISLGYDSEYPISETNNFYTTYAISYYSHDTAIKFGMNKKIEAEHILIDYKELRPTDQNAGNIYFEDTENIGEALLVLNEAFMEDMAPGVHFLEYVVNGKSEVLVFVRESATQDYQDAIRNSVATAGNSPSPSPRKPGRSKSPAQPADTSHCVITLPPSYLPIPTSSAIPSPTLPLWTGTPGTPPIHTHGCDCDITQSPSPLPSDWVPMSPPPSPSEKIYYDTWFYMYGDAVYNTVGTKSQNVCFYGIISYMNSIYYQETRLVPGVDYDTSGGNVEFTTEFLNTLPDGRNELTIYGNYNQDAQNAPSSAYITKISEPITAEYQSQYPLVASRNLVTTQLFAGTDNNSIEYLMNEAKEYEVYIDQKLVSEYAASDSLVRNYQFKKGESGAYFILYREVLDRLPAGLHVIEFVSDETSEIAYLVRYNETSSIMDIIKDAN